MGFDVRPMLNLSWMTLRGSLKGAKGIGLVIGAFLPTFVVVGLISYGTTGLSLVTDYEGLVQALFFPMVLLIITLLLAVPLFREEIDQQTLSYLLTRTLGKPFTVAGKYIGYVVAALLVLLPPVLVTFGIVAIWGQPPAGMLNGVLAALSVATVLGILAYGAFFLFLGIITRNALIIGLFYAFIWEYLIGGLTGIAPDLSIMHYLLSIPALWVSQGPLSTFSTKLVIWQVIAGPMIFAVAVLVLAIETFDTFGFIPTPD
jgi:ABC-2 type transport system permease protein